MAKLFRWLASLLLVVVTSGIGAFAFSAKAWAASDEIDSWTANYVVNADGSLSVTEKYTFKFGSSGRHGIDHRIMTREPYDDSQDAVYKVTVKSVTSPDAPAQFRPSTVGMGREQYLNLRIGDPNRTISKSTATYEIKYDVTGRLRTADGAPQLYADVLTDLNPKTSNIDLTVTVPQGVQDVICYAGKTGSETPCSSAKIDEQGRGRFTQNSKASNENLTIAAKLKPGAVADANPRLEPKAAESGDPRSDDSVDWTLTGILAAIAAACSGFFGWLTVRARRDKRFANEIPGNIPADPANAPTVRDDGKTVIPVRFTPPDMAIAHAGFLKDGSLDAEDLSAVLVALAVKGAIKLRMEKVRGRNTLYVVPADLRQTEYQYEIDLLERIFNGQNVEVALSDRGDLTTAYQELENSVWNDLSKGQLVTRRGRGKLGGITGSWWWIMALAWALIVSGMWWMFVPIAIIAVGIYVVRRAGKNGTRTAMGRAYADQIEGFRQYIATAEADQLRYEEGVDIFSRYLPWAIMFGEADRWTRVCRQLIEAGRMAPVDTYWYYGTNFQMDMFRWSMLNDVMTNVSTPQVDTSSSSSGWGGSSGFSGGFSGGGGGGGGSSSW